MDDHAEIVELFGRYADVADLKEFDEPPGRVLTELTVAHQENVHLAPQAG